MSDITKCTDIKCPSRKTCFRRTAKSSIFQSYSDFNRGEADKCEDYWHDTWAEQKERSKHTEVDHE